jgi:hypothetical protein
MLEGEHLEMPSANQFTALGPSAVDFQTDGANTAYCPHLDPIERLWGLMHKHVTRNRCHETFADFSAAILTFLREEVPRKWATYCDEVTDNFRVISLKDFRVLA